MQKSVHVINNIVTLEIVSSILTQNYNGYLFVDRRTCIKLDFTVTYGLQSNDRVCYHNILSKSVKSLRKLLIRSVIESNFCVAQT